jgi:putative hydrolase of HD superfamily
MVSLLAPTSLVKEDILTLWQEYEDSTTEESKLVKDLDKFEMIQQAFEYEKKFPDHPPLTDFYKSTLGVFKHPQVKQWVHALYQKRKLELNYDLD